MMLKRVVAPLSIIAFLAVLYYPVGHWLVQCWLSNPYYTHGFLIPLVSGFIIWMKRGELKQAKPSNIGAVVLALGMLIYILGFVWDMRFLSAFSFLIVLGGLILYFYGTKVTQSVAFSLGFLIFMIPLPFLDHVGYRLQSFSVDHSASLLETMGLPITTSGTEILLRDTAFNIGLPCSGMNSLIALLALAAVFAYLLTGPVYKRAIVFIAALPIAILANTLRIASIILVANYHGTEFATGFFHSLSSLLFFFIAFLFLVLCSKILGCRLIVPIQQK